MRYFKTAMGKIEYQGLKGILFLKIYIDVGSDRIFPSIQLEGSTLQLDNKSIKKTKEFIKDITALETINILGKDKIQNEMMLLWDALKPNPDGWSDELLLKVREISNG